MRPADGHPDAFPVGLRRTSGGARSRLPAVRTSDRWYETEDRRRGGADGCRPAGHRGPAPGVQRSCRRPVRRHLRRDPAPGRGRPSRGRAVGPVRLRVALRRPSRRAGGVARPEPRRGADARGRGSRTPARSSRHLAEHHGVSGPRLPRKARSHGLRPDRRSFGRGSALLPVQAALGGWPAPNAGSAVTPPRASGRSIPCPGPAGRASRRARAAAPRPRP